VLADVIVSYPSSDVGLEIGIDLTMQAPKAGDDTASQIWPDFGLGNLGPWKQNIKVLAPANTGGCHVSFLVVPFAGIMGQSTERWNTGTYLVDIDVRNGAEAHAQRQFDLGKPRASESK
jgi:hypothetical protein